MKIIFNDATELQIQQAVLHGDYLLFKTVSATPEELRKIFEDPVKTKKMTVEERGHQACCNKLAEYEDLEETGMISKWIPVKWHVILDAEREEEGIPDDIVYYLDCPMPEDGEEIIVTDGKRVWTDENCIDIVGHRLESGNDWKDIKAWMPLPERYKG